MAGGVTTTNMNDVFLAAIVEGIILDELRPSMTSREFLRWGAKGKSPLYQFNLQTDPGPTISGLTQGTDYTTVLDISDTNAQATASEVGIMTTVSDVSIEVSMIDILPHTKELVGRSTSEKWETDVAAKMDDFASATTAAGALTWDDVFATISAIEQRDASTGPLVGYLHPKQIGELRRDSATTLAPVLAQNAGGVPMSAITGETNARGDVGTQFGVRFFQTSIVASSGGNRQGSISVAGQCNGAYELWAPRVETERRATLRGFYVMSSACYGLANVEVTNRGQRILSAA
jgi:hypothetical protein